MEISAVVVTYFYTYYQVSFLIRDRRQQAVSSVNSRWQDRMVEVARENLSLAQQMKDKGAFIK